MPKYILFIALFFISVNLKAQSWELGGSVGAAGYMGDLNANNPVKVSGASYGGFVGYNFSGYLSAQVKFTHGTISGADSTSTDAQFRARNLNFSTTLNEVALIGQFNFFKYIPQIGKNKFTPFIYLGLGDVNYKPTATYNGVAYDLRSYKTEGETKPYANSAISIIYGVGAKYNIGGKFTLAADIGYRNPNTDYLDDISGKYPTPGSSATTNMLSDPSAGKIGSPGTQRGDGNSHDTYFFTQITLSYTFLSQKCYFEQ